MFTLQTNFTEARKALGSGLWALLWTSVPDATLRAKKRTVSIIYYIIKSDVKMPSAQSGLVMTALNRGNTKKESESAALF